MTSVWPALAPLTRAPQTTRLLRANDVGDTGFYGARVFRNGDLVVVRGEERAYIPADFDPAQGRITAAQLVARVESRSGLLFARRTGEAAHTFRRLPPGAQIENGFLRIGARVFSGWTELDRGAALGFFAGDHYVVRDPYPLSFRPLAQIPETLEYQQVNELTEDEVKKLQDENILGRDIELTEDEVKDLQQRGILGHDIPRGYSVFRIVSPMHEIHDSLFPEIVIESVVCDEVKGTITFNYSLKLTLANPDRFGSYVSPAVYVAVDTTRVGPRNQWTLKVNKQEGAQP